MDVPTIAPHTYPGARKMMQEWAFYLDKLKAGVEMMPLQRNQSA